MSPTGSDSVVPELIADGPFLAADARRARISRRRLDELIKCGDVVPVLFGVYLPSPLVTSIAARAAAVGLVLPKGAAVCRQTASWLHGIDARPPGAHLEPPPLECLVPLHSTPIRRPGIASFASSLPPDDTCLVEGIPTTTPLRTALDLARWSPRHMGLATLDAFAHSGLLHPRDVDQRLDSIVGQRFTARARELVQLCEPATESAGESWLRLRLIDGGLPRPTVQVSLRSPDGKERYRLDTGFVELKVAAEYDGEEFHCRTPNQARADESRRREILAAFGWTSVGFTSANVLAARPAAERVIAELIGWPHPLRRRLW